MKDDYNDYYEIYGNEIHLEQLYKICRISKRKAKWLLDSEIIPCINSGKRTWRYILKTDDVICFLRCRDAGQYDTIFPYGVFSSKKTKTTNQSEREAWLCTINDPCIRDELQRHYIQKLQRYPDALTTAIVSEITGYRREAVRKWISKGLLRAYKCDKTWIAKAHLIEFLCSYEYLSLRYISPSQRADMQGFLKSTKL